MKTKVLLIDPPVTNLRTFIDPSIYIPIGLLYIAGAIRDISEVRILDCSLISSGNKANTQSSFTKQYTQLIRKEVANFKPDIIGITILAMPRYRDAVITSKICKEVKKDTVVIFGGPDPSVRYSEMLDQKQCDYCVVGEGEFTMKELILAIKTNTTTLDIPGLAQINNEKLYFKPRNLIEDLDCLPLPAYDLINLKHYLNNNKLYQNRSIIPTNSISVITSRGCPFGCSFCSISIHMGNRYRSHSAEYVYKHLLMLSKTYNIKNIHFEDDNISLNKERFTLILEKIIKNNLPVNWDTPNGIRADTLDERLLKKMKKAGCKQITVAIESGSQRVLDNIIRKKTDLHYVINIAKIAKKTGLNPKAFYVIGFPEESKKEIKATLKLAINLFRNPGVIPILAIAIPLIGTPLFQECLEKKYINQDSVSERFLSEALLDQEPVIQTEDFSHHDISTLVNQYEKEFKRGKIFFGLKNPMYIYNILLKRLFSII